MELIRIGQYRTIVHLVISLTGSYKSLLSSFKAINDNKLLWTLSKAAKIKVVFDTYLDSKYQLR